MNRLPGYDPTTRRAERAVFVSLGVAALMTISFALFDAARFVRASDCIAAALRHYPAALARQQPAQVTTLTNATNNRTGRPSNTAIGRGKV
jgi:hypothetical protein